MSPSPNRTPTRQALHERSDSDTNIRPAVRLVPYTPPRLSGASDDLYSRTPLPTLPSHFLPPATGAAYLGSAYALEQSGSDVSAELFPAKLQAPPGSDVRTPHQPQQGDHSRPSTASSIRSNPRLKKCKHVALNPDNKTFRVLDVDSPDEVQHEGGGFKSPSSIASFSSHGRLSFDPPSIAASSRSPVSCIHQSTAATTPDIPGREITTPSSPDLLNNSPWNYRFVGGLRKVPKSPDLKQKALSSSQPLPPSLPGISEDPTRAPDLTTKPSFQSISSDSATSQTTNYKVYRSSYSPYGPVNPPSSSSASDEQMNNDQPYTAPQAENNPDIAPPSSRESNYQILSYSSPALSEIDLSAENYQTHGDTSSSPSYPAVSLPAGSSYSRESLVVPPLQPGLRRSTERFGYYKSRSRESLRSASLTSISSVLGQEAAQLILTSNPLAQHPVRSSQATSGPWAPSITLSPTRSHMQPHAHQWSSQLSTVPSESDGATDRDSRSWSDGNGRRSSGFLSPESRQMISIDSSLRQEYHSRTNSLEPPQPTYARPSPRLVEDVDEYGDGITDMQDLRLRPSRARLSDFNSVPSDTGRTNTMRSTTSSRTNSLLSSSIPTWARLYYGSGERKYLGAAGSSIEGTDSRPQSSMRSGSPDSSNFPAGIYSPRKRPRQIYPSAGPPSSHRGGSMEISPLPELDNDDPLIYNSFRRRFRPSSSILSPHLKRDKRASRSSKFFLEPASVDWSSGGNVFQSRRERLIVMFITGFIFPVAWIIGAFLPLPPSPELLMIENDRNTSNADISKTIAREFDPIDVSRYESAQWWRNLNRGMAVLGVLIIAVIIILAVIGVKQGWAK